MKQWAAKCEKTELLIQRFLTNCLNNFTCPFTASPTTQAPASRTSPPPPGTSSSSSSSSDSTQRGTQSRPRTFCVIFRRWKCERLQISSNRVVFCQIEMDRVAKWKEPGTPLTGALHQGLEYFVSFSEGGSVKACRYPLLIELDRVAKWKEPGQQHRVVRIQFSAYFFIHFSFSRG